MKEIDSQKAARVWQRVQNEEHSAATRNDSYPAMVQDQWQLSALYLQLSRQISGKDGALLLRLARESRAEAMCLRGICILTMGQGPMLSPTPAAPAPVEAMLRRCYGQEVRSLKVCENRSDDPEYGPFFSAMVQQKREHCCRVLELIGSSGRK